MKRSRVWFLTGAAGEFSSPVSTFCADSFQSPVHPSVTAVACKRSIPFRPSVTAVACKRSSPFHPSVTAVACKRSSPFHPSVTAVACKRSSHSPSRWQVMNKHTCTLCRWLWIKWCCKLVHGCVVYTEHVPRQQQFSHGTSHITTNITIHAPLQWVFKNTLYKAAVTHSVAYDKSTVGLLGSREQRCIVAILKCLGLISRWGAQQMFV